MFIFFLLGPSFSNPRPLFSVIHLPRQIVSDQFTEIKINEWQSANIDEHSLGW